MKHFHCILIITILFSGICFSENIETYTGSTSAGVGIAIMQYYPDFDYNTETVAIRQVFGDSMNSDCISNYLVNIFYDTQEINSSLTIYEPVIQFTYPGKYRFLAEKTLKKDNIVSGRAYIELNVNMEIPSDMVRPRENGFVMVDFFGKYDDSHTFSNAVVSPTLDKMQKSFAVWVSAMSVANYTDYFPAPKITAGEGEVQFSEDNLRVLTEEAHKRGMKVMWQHQLAPHPTLEKSYETMLFNVHNNYLPASFWKAWFDEYEKYIISQAKIAEKYKVDALQVFYGKFQTGFANESIRMYYSDAWNKLLAKIRFHYHGLIAVCPYAGVFTGSPEQYSYLNTLKDVDVFMVDLPPLGGGFPIFGTRNFYSSLTPSMPELLQCYRYFFAFLNTFLEKNRAKLFVINSAASCDGQDGFVFIDHKTNHNNVDYNEQNMYYEAFFAAALEFPRINGVFSGGYDWFDEIDFQQDHFDKFEAPSVRGKPAEKIVTEWFRVFDQ